MSEDAGSIYSEVRLKIDRLQADISQAITAVGAFGNKIVDMSNTASNLFSNNYADSIKKVESYIKSLDKAVTAGAMTQKQAIEASLTARKQELAYIQATAAKKGGYTDKEIADLKRSQIEVDKLETEYKQLGGASATASQGIQAGALAIAAAVGSAVISAIGKFAEFEQSMANVRSVTNSTASEFQILKNAAEEAGASTRFSASEAADALYYLGSAGLTATQAVAALDGVLALASATGSDLASTADTVSAALSQFGLGAGEAGRVANVFAAATAASQANLEKLQASMRQVGPVAGSLGISLEETTASLAALYNAGFQGEAAGTALKSALLDMSSSTSVVSDKLKEAGISLQDAQGQFVGLTASIDILSKSGVSMGEIFGKETAAQMTVLAKTGGAALTDLEKKITGTNAAARMTAIQTDTLKGAMDEFSSAAENAGNKSVESIEPMLKGLINTGTGIAKIFAGLPGPIQATITTAAGLSAAVAGAVGVLSLFGVAVSGIFFPITAIVGGTIALIAGISKASEEAAQATYKNISANDALIGSYAKRRASINELLGDNAAQRSDEKLTIDQIERLKQLYPELAQKINLNTASVRDAAMAARELNAIQGKAAISAIDEQIAKEKKYRAELQANIDKLKALGPLTGVGKKTFEDAQKRVTLSATLVAELESQKSKIDYETNGMAARAELLTSQATKAAADIANAQAVSTKKIIENLRAEQIKRTAMIGDKKAEAAITKVFADKIIELEQRLANEQVSIADEKRKTLEESRKLLEERALTDATRLDKAEKDELAALLKSKDINKNYESDVTTTKAYYAAERQRLADEAAKALAEANKIEIKAETGYADALALATNDIEYSYNKQRDAALATVDAELKAGRISAEEAGKSKAAITAYWDGLIAKQKADLAAANKAKEDKDNADALKKEQDKATASAAIEADLADEKSSIEKGTQAEREAALDVQYQKYLAAGIDEITLEKWKADQKKKILQETSDSWQDNLKKDLDNVKTFAQEIIGSLTGLFSALDAMVQASVQNQIDELTSAYDLQKELLENDGLTKEEALQKDIDDAIAAGDTEAQVEAEKQLNLYNLDKEYQKKKAKLEYDAAMSSWTLQLINATATGAMATLNAVASAMSPMYAPLNAVAAIALGATAAGAAALNIGAVAMAKPTMPKLATGGIILPTAGGTAAVMAENGSPELALNMGAEGKALLGEFARAIVAEMGSSKGGGGMMQIINQIDGQTLTDIVVDYINNGRAILKAGK